jgi:hypothetical protein
MAPDLGVFLPTTTAVVNNSSSALTTGLIQAGLMGASAGIDAGLKYGSPKGSGSGSGSGGTMPYAERMGDMSSSNLPYNARAGIGS